MRYTNLSFFYYFPNNVETTSTVSNNFIPELQTLKLSMELNHNQIHAQIDHHQGEYWQTSNFCVPQAADIAHANTLLWTRSIKQLN
jgi:hypothetical protein